jgi:hypothetical protein
MYTEQELALKAANYELAEAAAKATPEYKALQEAWKPHDDAPPGSEARKAAWPAINEAIERWQATEEFKAMKEAEYAPFTPPLVSRVDPNAPDMCAGLAELASQIGACAKADWRGGLCNMLEAQLARCSDPQVTDPLPDQDGCTLTSDEDRQRDRAQLETAAVIACQMIAHYGPDGGDPCRPEVGSGAPDIDRNSKHWAETCLLMGVCTAVEVACTSALTQPGQDQESCAGKATIEALFPDIGVIIADGIEKIGGPGWVPPSTGGPPTGPRASVDPPSGRP